VPHWISEFILSIFNSVPALIVEESSPHFALIRAMFGLILVVLIVYLIAMRPLRPLWARCWQMVSGLFASKQ
jgi:hypothetical protein